MITDRQTLVLLAIVLALRVSIPVVSVDVIGITLHQVTLYNVALNNASPFIKRLCVNSNFETRLTPVEFASLG